MIAQIFPQFYDTQGHKILLTGRSERRWGFRPTHPMAMYATQPLKVKCATFEDVRHFLRTCRYSSRGSPKKDYWQPPGKFEETRTGNCVDLALWVWRQLLEMGYRARFTGGKAGKFGEGHAWVTFKTDTGTFLLEPQMWPLGLRMPRVLTLRYHPRISVVWDGKRTTNYEHENRDSNPPLQMVPALGAEYFSIYAAFWLKVAPRIPLVPFRIIRNLIRKQP